MQIITVDPKDCTRWKYADRGNFEFGDIDSLAEDIKNNGQIEPVHLRMLKGNPKFKYEVIAGSRRWKACLDADLLLKAVIDDVTDEHAAIIQIKENQGLDICDYSKGLYYTSLLSDLNLKQVALAKNLNITRQKLVNYLYFAKIPKEIWHAVDNVTKVTARTAYSIFVLSQKGQQYIDALIDCADEIRKGMGANSLEQLVLSKVKDDSSLISKVPLTLADGTVVGTWKNGSFTLNKDLNINKEKFLKHILKFF
uniref:ParB/RepB/Spo0J family partition protein n=1 Tax=Rickettsia endosymbiont of Ixodes pacificus TaxID=1133329 RepID=UPI00067A46D2|nr:ParB/RepB/Spo0J family partition protein [Rickettsia endosymbiont of Ixodes pacificus]AKS10320.1 plasmid partitioning protein ParB [Rickettsia endosymbiont of Ixodes pacificus]